MSVVLKALGATAKATGKGAVNTAKFAKKHGIKKVSDDVMERNLIKRALPYEFTLGGVAMMGAGAGLWNAGAVAQDVHTFQNARNIGELSVSTMANHVGVTQSNHSAKFVRSIPTEISETLVDKANIFRKGPTTGIQYYDDNAGGDLVLALHKLR